MFVDNKNLNRDQVSTGNVGEHVQLRVPAVQMRPEIESEYISSVSTEDAKYMDYYNFTIGAIEKGQQLNNLVSNGTA